jgi:hypothetical protein
VKRCAWYVAIRIELHGSRHAGFGLHARTRKKAFLGFCPSSPHRRGEAGSFGSQVNVRSRSPQGLLPAAKHIGRTRNPTRVCLGVTTETSEVGTVWRRLDKIREGSRRVSILDAEKASARGASKRDCPKLATANSFADSPLP